jgi:hypothetical protein
MEGNLIRCDHHCKLEFAGKKNVSIYEVSKLTQAEWDTGPHFAPKRK